MDISLYIVDRGLKINMKELREIRHRFFTKKTKYCDVVSCELVLLWNSYRLKVLVKGDKSFVTSWRCGLVTAHHGIELQSADETDEFIWSQKQVDPHSISYDIFAHSMAERALHSNISMPTLILAYHTLPSTKFSEIASLMRKTNSLCFDRSMRSVQSFGKKNQTISDFHNSNLLNDAFACTSTGSVFSKETFEEREPDSGVESPELEDEQKEPEPTKIDVLSEDEREVYIHKMVFNDMANNVIPPVFIEEKDWEKRSRFQGLPLLCADDLNVRALITFDLDDSEVLDASFLHAHMN